MNESVHRGSIVEVAVRRSGISLTKVAERLHINRSTLYNYFNNSELDFEIIAKIGTVVDNDFSKDFPEVNNYKLSIVLDEGVEYGSNSLFKECQQELNKWKNIAYNQSTEIRDWQSKYIKLQEDYFTLKISSQAGIK